MSIVSFEVDRTSGATARAIVKGSIVAHDMKRYLRGQNEAKEEAIYQGSRTWCTFVSCNSVCSKTLSRQQRGASTASKCRGLQNLFIERTDVI